METWRVNPDRPHEILDDSGRTVAVFHYRENDGPSGIAGAQFPNGIAVAHKSAALAVAGHALITSRATEMGHITWEYVTCPTCFCVQAVEMVQLGLCYLCASPVFVESGLK